MLLIRNTHLFSQRNKNFIRIVELVMSVSQDFASVNAWTWSSYGSGAMPGQYYISAIDQAWQL